MIDFVYKSHYDVNDFRRLIHLLRQKDGCPWDSVQTHASIRNNFLEETYEVCEAIDNGDNALLKEELGDVLMQVIFHASIEEDAGHFDLDDVADSACKKLIFRHPNLFSEEGSSLSWDELKQQEKGYTTRTQSLNAVARSLPALWRAKKVQKRAASFGFDWPDVAPAMHKVEEEYQELRQAIDEQSNIEEELGDLLFAVVNAARHLNIDPEQALNRATDKFISRFATMEQIEPEDWTTLSPTKLHWLWQQAKRMERE
jgi:tetrapyrrole methylase family protein / MazG family protein